MSLKVLFYFVFGLLFIPVEQASGQTQKIEDIEIKVAEGYPLDSLLNFTELAEVHGYPAEQHSVVTEDGYILTIFRIPKGKNCEGPVRRPPVLLMHGLLMSSDAWLDAGPRSGLAYLIADACYDLWAGNTRGNYYGKRHVKYNPEMDNEFWDFSVNEIGTYDVPAMVDYVREYTESEQIIYIGYSQGGSTYAIMCSQRPGYSNKVKVAIFLEPDSRNKYLKSLPGRKYAEYFEKYYPVLIDLGFCEAYPLGGRVQRRLAYLCKDYYVADTFCRNLLYAFDSPHPESVETETIRVLFGHFPAGTSVKNLAWYGQSMTVNDLQNFDYGTTANMELYGSAKPPAYNLSATTTPAVVINGRNDFLAVPADVEWFTSHLPHVLEHYIVTNPLWNHLDVPYSKLTSKLIFPKISEHLYQNSVSETLI